MDCLYLTLNILLCIYTVGTSTVTENLSASTVDVNSFVNLDDLITVQLNAIKKENKIKSYSCFLSNSQELDTVNSLPLVSYGCSADIEVKVEKDNKFTFNSSLLHRSYIDFYCICTVWLCDSGKVDDCSSDNNCSVIFPFLENNVKLEKFNVVVELPKIICKEENKCDRFEVCEVWNSLETCQNYTEDFSRDRIMETITDDVCWRDNSPKESSEGFIRSPNYPQSYPSGIQCTKTITVSENEVISLNVQDFNLENPGSTTTECNDYVEIFDSENKVGNTTYCGSNSTAINFVSKTNEIKVTFRSNRGLQSRGFEFKWETKPLCTNDSFRCWNGDCINSTLKCNGKKDCSDDSDEIECSKSWTTNSQCGKTSVAPEFNFNTKRIVGGDESVEGSWPWFVLLQIYASGRQFLCGGSIISSRWIVTAGHCKISVKNVDTIIAGLQRLYDINGKNTRKYFPLETHTHESYAGSPYYYDLAVIKTTEEIEFTDFIRPICLATPKMSEIDTVAAYGDEVTCIATGFGRLYYNGPVSNTLQQVRVPLINFEECTSGEYKRYNLRKDVQMCAGDLQRGGVDACQGDSGGPLVCLYKQSTWFQVGVVSFGRGCAWKGNPGVYTRMSGVYDWISSKTGVDSYQKVDLCSDEEATGPFGEFTFAPSSSLSDSSKCKKELNIKDAKTITLTIRVSSYFENHLKSNGKCDFNITILEKNNEVSYNLCASEIQTHVTKCSQVSLSLNTLPTDSNAEFSVIWEAYLDKKQTVIENNIPAAPTDIISTDSGSIEKSSFIVQTQNKTFLSCFIFLLTLTIYF